MSKWDYVPEEDMKWWKRMLRFFGHYAVVCLVFICYWAMIALVNSYDWDSPTAPFAWIGKGCAKSVVTGVLLVYVTELLERCRVRAKMLRRARTILEWTEKRLKCESVHLGKYSGDKFMKKSEELLTDLDGHFGIDDHMAERLEAFGGEW